jgi:hypothetical protein
MSSDNQTIGYFHRTLGDRHIVIEFKREKDSYDWSVTRHGKSVNNGHSTDFDEAYREAFKAALYGVVTCPA